MFTKAEVHSTSWANGLLEVVNRIKFVIISSYFFIKINGHFKHRLEQEKFQKYVVNLTLKICMQVFLGALKFNFILFMKAIFFIRTFEGCFFYCSINKGKCSAFEFANGICLISGQTSFFNLAKYSIRKSIWIDPLRTIVNVTTCKKFNFD